MIENPRGLEIPLVTQPLLHALFAGYARVIIQAELSGGVSGSRVLLVRPIGADGRPELPAVVKIAPADLIEREWQAYQNYIQNKLLGIADVRGEPVMVTQEQERWGALYYPLLGGGEFDVESLHRYAQHADVEDVNYVLRQRLFPSMETLWRYNVPAPAFHFRRSYDHLLPVNLLLAPVDVENDARSPDITCGLRPGEPLASYPDVEDYVRLENFVVTEIEPAIAAVTLNWSSEIGAAYRVRLQPVTRLENYQIGASLAAVIGKVRATRPASLRELAQHAVGDKVDFGAPRFPVPNIDVPWPDLPNPLLAWSDILNTVLDVKVADIHGDFNLENILVDPAARDVRLIDFALARRDHVLHDLLRLETEIVTKLLPERLVMANLPGASVCAIYVHLHNLLVVDADAALMHSIPVEVEQPLRMLKALRTLARDYLFRRGDWNEYYRGLTLYLLGALKFKNLDRLPSAPLPKQIAFWAAAQVCALQESTVQQFTEMAVQWSRVAHYFPPTMPASAALDAQHADHLYALLRTVMTYLPRRLAIDILEQRPLVPGHFLAGTLLFADISGFTALSESLRYKGGVAGAEELVQIINQYLDVMLAILFQYNGELLRFGGDAMLCLFTGKDDHGATAAVQAAWTMKQAMSEHFAEVTALQEIFPLNMKVGGHSGQLFVAQVGTADHKEYVLTGRAVEQTAHAEAAAQRGDVLISRETYAHVHIPLEVIALDDGASSEPDQLLRIISLDTATVNLASSSPAGPRWNVIEQTLSTVRRQVATLLHCLERAVVYLPTGILSQLVLDPLQEQIEGQYRRVTVVFANLIGMPAIISARGIADASGIASDLNEYFQAALEEVHYYGGMVNKVDLYDQGDKIIVLFGAPIAHEQDVRRAALTALAIQDALHRLTSPVASALLSQRIGIHTGFVFAGNVGSAMCRRREYTVMGDTVNLAARLMSKAPIGHIWISEALREQLGAAFDIEALPPVHFKGLSAPTTIYRLHGVREGHLVRRSRLLHSALVGRAEELEMLLSYLADSASGLGKQMIALVGEAGVGKTRLLTEWKQQAARVFPELTCKWLYGCGQPYGQQTHGLWRDVLVSLLDWRVDDTQEMRWYKLSRQIKKAFADVSGWYQAFMDASAYLGHFLGLDLTLKQGLSERVARLDAQTLQMHTRLAVCDLLAALTRDSPLILVLDDLHWADDASLELLEFVLDHLDDRLPLLLCLSYRLQKERPIWRVWQRIERTYPDAHQLILKELPEQHIHTLLHNLLPGVDVRGEFETLIQHATDGNPLYIEEVLHILIEEGLLSQQADVWQFSSALPLTSIRVPPSLHQIIQERIDELDYGSPGARRVLWMAAVIGKRFREDLLVHLYTREGRSRAELQRHLRELRNAALIDRASDPTSDGVTGFLGPRLYYFPHGLVRQVAYENILLSSRRRYHRVVAEWIEKTLAEALAQHYDDLSQHFEQAQVWEKAFTYHRRAGNRDAGVYAHMEAAAHFRSALACAAHIACDGEALAGVQFALGKVLALQGEFDAALHHLRRADEAWAVQPGAEQARARVCYHIGRLYEQRGGEEHLTTALRWRDQGLRLLSQAPTSEAARLHLLGAAVAVRQADWEGVVRESRCTLALAQKVADQATIGGAYRMLARVAWGRGELEVALEHCQRSLQINQELNDLVNIAKDYANQGILMEDLGEWRAAKDAYQEALKLQERIGDQYQIAITVCNLANLLCRLRDFTSGITYAQRGLEIFASLDAVHGIIFAHTVLGTLFFCQSDLEAARAELLTARELMVESGARELEPTVGRWLAEVYLAAGNLPQTAVELHKLLAIDAEALDTEVEPVQRLWARLLAAGGRVRDAYQVLQESRARLEHQKQQYEMALTLQTLSKITAQMDGGDVESQTYRIQAQSLLVKLRGEEGG